ncbi:MAG: endolytic transglycosylase MltG [Deltaproteobacteria bacterium]|nr:endolytic transglycosylase MltG [Deltaproteobacteria bacterium]
MARRRRRRLRGATAILLTTVAAAVAAVAWLLLLYPKQPMPGARRSMVVEMPTEVTRLAGELEARGIVDDGWIFGAYLRLTGAGSRLRTGDVLLSTGLTPRELRARVAQGYGRVPVRVVIPEGFTRHDVADRLAARGICSEEAFLAATDGAPPMAPDAPSHEGYLFPDTYDFDEGTDAAVVVERMLENYERRTEPLFDEHAAALATLSADLGFTAHQVLVLASVVEKEAAVAVERPTIAGVFLNRLRSEEFRPRHRLQADPTVSYGCVAEPSAAPSCARYGGRITRAMLRDGANRYNTYRHGGLPPGPICNPGLPALRAVLDPEVHDYLYFVARGGGRHAFSEGLDSHNANVDQYLRAE